MKGKRLFCLRLKQTGSETGGEIQSVYSESRPTHRGKCPLEKNKSTFYFLPPWNGKSPHPSQGSHQLWVLVLLLSSHSSSLGCGTQWLPARCYIMWLCCIEWFIQGLSHSAHLSPPHAKDLRESLKRLCFSLLFIYFQFFKCWLQDIAEVYVEEMLSKRRNRSLCFVFCLVYCLRYCMIRELTAYRTNRELHRKVSCLNGGELTELLTDSTLHKFC